MFKVSPETQAGVPECPTNTLDQSDLVFFASKFVRQHSFGGIWGYHLRDSIATIESGPAESLHTRHSVSNSMVGFNTLWTFLDVSCEVWA